MTKLEEKMAQVKERRRMRTGYKPAAPESFWVRLNGFCDEFVGKVLVKLTPGLTLNEKGEVRGFGTDVKKAEIFCDGVNAAARAMYSTYQRMRPRPCPEGD